MKQKEKLEYLKDLFLKTGFLYTWHFSPDMRLLSHNCPLGEQIKNILLLSNCYTALQQYVLEQDKPLFVYDDLSFLWAVCPFYINQTLDSVYLLGPVCGSHTSDDFIKSRMDKLNISVKNKRMMLDTLDQIPVIPPVFFSYHTCQFYYTLTGKTITMSEIHYHSEANMENSSSVNELLQPVVFGNSSTNLQEDTSFHNSYQYECMILENVEKGNQSSLPTSQGLVQIGMMCPGNPLRQAKDEIIVYTALVSRAAIRGGYSPEKAYACSDYYIQSIEAAEDIPTVYHIAQTMLEDFVQRVNASKQYPVHNALIKKCMNYIDSHLTEKIDLEGLAQELGYTKYYLTRRFKEENKLSINQYILAKRIDYAKLLLTNSRLSILEISDKLHFSSPSHFTSVFRKTTGMTPTEYRQKV